VGHQADLSQDHPVTELGDALQGVCLDGGSIPPTSTTFSFDFLPPARLSLSVLTELLMISVCLPASSAHNYIFIVLG